MSGNPAASQQTQAIIQASDELIRRLTQWAQDKQRNPVVPQPISVQIQTVDAICEQSSPTVCEAIRAAIGRLVEEYRGYVDREHGKVRTENGAPGPSFWAAVKNFIVARNGSEKPLAEKFEPVGVLLRQGVSHAQIGLQIYGRRGVGPFIQSNGDVDVGLMEKEGSSPGSVIPADWVPPWATEAHAVRQKQLDDRLKLFTHMEVAKQYDDPCTVEEMLQQGAFVQQIERAKGVSRETVLEAAKKIGIEAVDGPGFRRAEVGGVGNPTTSQANEADQSNQPATDKLKQSKRKTASPVDLQSVPTRGPLTDELKQQILDIYKKAAGQKGAAEIAAELRRAGHEGVTTHTVSATISHWKRKQKEEDSGSADAA